MATSKIQILIEADDKASAKLKAIAAGMDETGAATTRTTSTLDKFKSAAFAVTAVVGSLTAAAYAGKKIWDATVQTWTNNALAVGDLADKLGTTTEEASALREMSQDLGVNLGSLEMGFRTMARQGLDPSIEGLIEARRQIFAAKSDSDRLATAQRLLGRAGGDLIPIFKQLNESELRNYVTQMRAGQVVTEQQVRQAREMRDQLDNLNDSWSNVKLVVGAGLAPTLIEDFARINDLLSGNITFWDAWAQRLGLIPDSIRNLEAPIGSLEERLRGIQRAADDAESEAQGLTGALGSIPTHSDWTFQMHTPWSKEVVELAKQMGISPARAFVLLTQAKVSRQIEESGVIGATTSANTNSRNIPGGQHGLNMIVPPGYPNDSFPVLASSGERVIVIPQTPNVTHNNTINMGGQTLNNGMDMRQLEDALRRVLS